MAAARTENKNYSAAQSKKRFEAALRGARAVTPKAKVKVTGGKKTDAKPKGVGRTR
jgi:hypothetical protein